MATSDSEPHEHVPEEHSVLRAIRALVVSADEPHGVASVLLELLSAELDVEGACVAVRRGGNLDVLQASGSFKDMAGQSFLLPEPSITERAIAEGRTLVYDGDRELHANPRFVERYGIKQGVVAPLIAGGTTIGVLLAANPVAGGFTPGEVARVSRLAELGSLAMHNSWLLAREQQQSRDAATLADIVQELNQSLEFERVTSLVVSKCAALLGAQGAALSLFVGTGVDTASATGSAATILAPEPELVERITRMAATARGVIRLSDPTRPEGGGPGADEASSAACVATPLFVADRPIGALIAMASPGHAFGDRDAELMRALATHAAVAIENARLYRAAAHTARHAEILSAAARSLSYATDATSFFHELSRVAYDVLGASGLTVYSIGPRSGTVRVAYMAGAGVERLADVAARAMDNPEVARLIIDGIEGFFDDVRADRAMTIWGAAPGTVIPPDIVSLARLPLLVEGRLRGALSLRWAQRQEFPEDEQMLLRDFATQVALALRNAEQFEAERRSREVAEAAAVIARSALGAVDPAHVATLALDAVDRAIPSPGKAIGIVDTSRTALRYLAASGTLSGLAHTAPTLARSAAALSATPGAHHVDAAGLAGIEEGQVVPPGCYLIPLMASDQLLGVLWASMPANGNTPDADLDTLRNLAASVALAADVLILNEEEQKRRAREHMLATALATMDQAVLIIGLDRRVLYANAAAMAEYGYPFDSVPDIPFDRLVDSAAVARRVSAAPTAAPGSAVWEAEHTHRRRDGTTFPASVLLSYIRDPRNVPVGQVVTVRNLTAERRVEDQLRQSEKLAALGDLVAGVAHELNNPLAGISAFAQLLMEDPLGEEQHESVRLIKREADRAVGVIRDLLLFSRKSSPTQTLVNVNEMVELTLRLRGYGLRSTGIDVRLELDPDVPMVAGDAQRLQQVLLNLIINAEYALQRADSKRLSVRSERTSEGVALVVQDSGAGMDEETRQRIFEPFFTTKPAGEGTGLGLSVSYGIVRTHGGFISVDSAPGGGTTFRIELPAAKDITSAASA